MNLTVEFSQKDIEEAIKSYCKEETGLEPGKVSININPGCADQRDYAAPSVTATCEAMGRGKQQ